MKKGKVIRYLFMILMLLWILLPLYWLVNLSFMFEVDISSRPPQFVPQNPTDHWYRRIIGYAPLEHELVGGLSTIGSENLRTALINSFIVALPVSSATIIVASLVGYAFGRFKFRYKTPLLIFLLGSRSLPPVSIIIPYFIFFTQYLNLFGTVYGLMIVYFSITVPIISWVLMGYFASLPLETERAARVDGCTRLMALRKIIIPLAAPGIAAAFILSFLMCYNEFLFAMILTMGTKAATVPAQISSLFFIEVAMPEMCALITLAMIPPMIIALIFQKYITRLKIVDPVTVIEQ